MNKKRIRHHLVTACRQSDGISDIIENDLDILCYTFEEVSLDTAEAFYRLILSKNTVDSPILNILRKLLKINGSSS